MKGNDRVAGEYRTAKCSYLSFATMAIQCHSAVARQHKDN